MQHLKERTLFFRGALQHIHAVGSITPSSRSVAKAMTAHLRQRPAPRRILEVGAGTGPITARIVRDMRPGDHLDIYEIDPKFTTFLAQRFETEPAFQKVKNQVTIYTAGIETIERVPTYDIIISAVPFTNLPPALVRDFFDTYAQILNPDGVLTYIEYAFGRALFTVLSRQKEKQRLKAVSQVVNHYVRNYQVKHRFVLLNAPPARIRSLQFR
ncbi:MAG: methyltransferase domain-containing protein [Anaerolineae bacterium]|nr:methyltransferase domain-containing protein [Anaerolineae bacterium]